MYYVYIIRSKQNGSCYTGSTSNLKKRLQDHNWRTVKSTKSKSPYKLVWCCIFASKKQALGFEDYLKTGSGIAFAKKRLIKN